MSPSQEILHSIEERLRQLAQEIAALQSARAELQAQAPVRTPVKPKPSDRKATRSRRSRTAQKIAAVPGVSEEEWLERRTAELAAQSREAAAA